MTDITDEELEEIVNVLNNPEILNWQRDCMKKITNVMNQVNCHWCKKPMGNAYNENGHWLESHNPRTLKIERYCNEECLWNFKLMYKVTINIVYSFVRLMDFLWVYDWSNLNA